MHNNSAVRAFPAAPDACGLKQKEQIMLFGKKKEKNKVMTVTKDTVIGDLLDVNADVSQFFLAIGMHCLGCPVSRGETIEEACAVHGTDAAELIRSINDFLAKENK